MEVSNWSYFIFEISLNKISFKIFFKGGEFDDLEIDKISLGAEIYKIITEKHAQRMNEIRLDRSQIMWL